MEQTGIPSEHGSLPNLQAVASQATYQNLVQGLMAKLAVSGVQGPERIREICESMGVGACFLVRAEAGEPLRFESQFHSMDLDVQRLQDVLRGRLLEDTVRSRLVTLPQSEQAALKGRNIVYSRIGQTPGEARWLDAIVFAGRQRPPIVDASPGYVTFDVRILEMVADELRGNVPNDVQTAMATSLLSAQAAILRRLSKSFGPNIVVGQGQHEIVISRIQPQFDCPQYLRLGVAELCILELLGAEVFSRVRLNSLRNFTQSYGHTEEFGIELSGWPVYGEKLTVMQLEDSNDAEATMPIGPWWFCTLRQPEVPVEKAKQVAQRHFASTAQGRAAMTVDFRRTVLWTEDCACRLVHELLIRGVEVRTRTVFVDANTGDLIKELQSIWS